MMNNATQSPFAHATNSNGGIISAKYNNNRTQISLEENERLSVFLSAPGWIIGIFCLINCKGRQQIEEEEEEEKVKFYYVLPQLRQWTVRDWSGPFGIKQGKPLRRRLNHMHYTVHT